MITLLNAIGTAEIAVGLSVIAVFFAVANYGKNTILGYSGTLLLAVLTTPIVAFLINYLIKGARRRRVFTGRSRYHI